MLTTRGIKMRSSVQSPSFSPTLCFFSYALGRFKIKMVKLLRLRSLWGVEPGENLGNWATLFPDWKNQGYGQ